MEAHFRFAQILANTLDNQFGWGPFRFGLNVIIDLLPFAGDTVICALSFYLVWVAIQMKVPQEKISQMVATILVSYGVGLVPLFGDLAYFTIRPNMRNLKILEEHYLSHTLV